MSLYENPEVYSEEDSYGTDLTDPIECEKDLENNYNFVTFFIDTFFIKFVTIKTISSIKITHDVFLMKIGY
jgi:hypothetical protein